jgi:hypothetical protein
MIGRELLAAPDFTMVRAELVRALGGDAGAALVLTRIHWRLAALTDGAWWRGTLDEIADETGLSRDQVNRSVRKLRLAGHLETSQEHGDGAWDRTLSYRLVLTDSAHVAESPQHLAGSPDIHVAESPDVPLSKTKETKSGARPRAELTRLPEDWRRSSDPSNLAWEDEHHIPSNFTAGATDRFRNYWHNQTGAKALKRNWSLAWRVWVSRDWERLYQSQRDDYWKRERGETA